MPFVPNTPESLLKKPDDTTCRGITSNGDPCRRPIAQKIASEGSYCWQHKEQANLSTQSSPGPRASNKPILDENRTSLDTLADRLGLVDLQDKEKPYRRKHREERDGYASEGRRRRERPKKKTQSGNFCFCFNIEIEEPPRPAPARPQPRPIQRTSAPNPHRRSKTHVSTPAAIPSKTSTSQKTATSQTAQIKNLIPDTLDTTTASALMAELARPHVESDTKGYIYMFWLPPTGTKAAAPVDAARDLLSSDPPTQRPSQRSRRASEVVSTFATSNRAHTKKTMVLKIGRAANVQRRMNQWQRQCGRDVEVLRVYPYAPSSPRATPHAHRVERLIHLELSGMGMRADLGSCDACGREHREWFEVEANRAAVREVDAVIRRWVEWDERNS